MTRYVVSFCRRYLAGTAKQDDARRGEFVLNTLLCGLTMAGILGLMVALILIHFGESPYRGNTIPDLGFFTLVSLGLWRLSRKGHSLATAYILLAFIAVSAYILAITWSFELPSVALVCALLIMIASRILETRSALAVTLSLVIALPVLGNEQVAGILHPRTGWLNQPLQRSDCLDYALLLGLIGLVSWLANLEIDRSLNQARASQNALLKERDSLEKKVAARTSQLEQAQLMRVLELQRFAEFGRLSAHFLHEIANPLTAAALHLELTDHQQSKALKQVRKDIQQLERYVDATRKQLKSESRHVEFSVRNEVIHAHAVLAPLAKRANVNLKMTLPPAGTKLFGDPVKFNQIVANLVVNAIDAYKGIDCPKNRRLISVGFKQSGNFLELTVHDWAKGIKPDELPKLFQPFFTTKQDTARGLGIGLSLVKQAIEQDFSGGIQVSSNPQRGTLFTAKLQTPMRHSIVTAGKPKSFSSVQRQPTLQPAR